MIIVEKANHGQVTMVSFMIFLVMLYNIDLIKYYIPTRYSRHDIFRAQNAFLSGRGLRA